ncbi:WD40-repeat-containing domain protein [Mycena floridula]|nr:WD40-repeat-containing domain protein [Mycena floridula]
MDISYRQNSDIYQLLACKYDDAEDLLAIGTEHSVQVLRVTPNSCEPLATFHIGSRLTALAWSPKTLSPSASDDWVVEIAAATIDFGLHLLHKSSIEDETVFHFGGGLSGHHGKVTDMAFCGGGKSQDSARYVASVSDDRMLMVWDLTPPTRSSSEEDVSPFTDTRPQPTAYVIPFAHPLASVSSNPSTAKEFLVSDSRGSIFLADWRTDPDDHAARHSSLVELLDPHGLADASMGLTVQWSGSVAWRQDTADIIGAVYGSRFSIWDISKLRGGKPYVSGNSFPEGGHRFRWCQTQPEYFAISTQSPLRDAVIHIHNTQHINTPNVVQVAARPHVIRDFDFLSSRGIPRLAAAVGRTVIIFPIGTDS